jgi:hypothetical protein
VNETDFFFVLKRRGIKHQRNDDFDGCLFCASGGRHLKQLRGEGRGTKEDKAMPEKGLKPACQYIIYGLDLILYHLHYSLESTARLDSTPC